MRGVTVALLRWRVAAAARISGGVGHSCGALDKRFIETAGINMAALGIMAGATRAAGMTPADVVVEANARGSARHLRSLGTRRSAGPDANRRDVPASTATQSASRPRGSPTRASGCTAPYGLANFARDVLLEAQPALQSAAATWPRCSSGPLALGSRRRSAPPAARRPAAPDSPDTWSVAGSMPASGIDTRLVRARVERHVRRHDLIPPGGEVTCLVSGGADSTCLWHALRALGYRVSALHVDHGLRGEESDEDARFCRERARRRGRRRRAAARRRTSCASFRYSFATEPPPRDRAHRLRPGRDRALPARLERRGRRDQGAARGRRRPAAARPLARGDRGLLPGRGPPVPRRLLEPRHEARPDPRRDPAAAPRASTPRADANLLRARRASARVPPRARRAARLAVGSTRVDLGGGVRRSASTTASGSSARRSRSTAGSAGASWRSSPRAPGLKVRGWRAGDRLAGRRKKVQDVFVDAKVPRSEREAWPLVVRGDEVVAVPGIVDVAGREDAVRRPEGGREVGKGGGGSSGPQVGGGGPSAEADEVAR